MVVAETKSMAKEYKLEKIFASKGRTRIVVLLAEEIELHISAIVEKTRLNHKTVDDHLEVLVDEGFVQEKLFGRLRVFRFKLENFKAKALKRAIEIIEAYE